MMICAAAPLQESFRQLYREGGLEDNTITIEVPPNSAGTGGIVGNDGPMGGAVSCSLTLGST
jgi:hypothetical protein